MAQPYQKLFNTIQEIAAAGKVKLSADERATIERETRDLLSKSKMKNYKFASAAPAGIEMLLGKLQGADAEEAYELIVEFMEHEDEPEGAMDEKHEEKHEEKEEGIIENLDKGVEELKDVEEKEELSEIKDKADEKKEEKEEKFEKKDDDKPKEKPDMEKEKKEVLSRVRKTKAQMGLDKKDDEKDDEKDEMPGKGRGGPGKGDGPKMDGKGPHGPGKGDMKDLKDKKDKDDKKAPSMDEMGVDEKEIDPTLSLRAKKVRVKVTAERNIIAYHEDYGPIFLITPDDKTKKSKLAMVRLANRAYGLAVNKGFAVAASTLGGRMLHTAGVDDDVETVTEEMPEAPATEGVLDEAEDVFTGEDMEEKNVGDDVQAEADDDIEDEPTKVARYEVVKKAADGDVTDAADFVSDETPDKGTDDVTAESDDLADEPVETPPDSTVETDEVDFKTAKKIEADYRKLYAARLKKAEENFVKKFSRCMRVASRRMLLNHDENPWKIASADVLMSDDIEFENGDLFRPMPEHIAVQLTELISSEGHDDFVLRLMDRTADLMEKSDEYLEDVETDLANLNPVAVEVSPAPTKPSREARSAKMRRAASKGNFGMNGKVATARPKDKQDSLRDALSGRDSRVNRDLGIFRG